MVWLNEHKHVWRTATLIILLVAILGPWWFDLINVPAKYTCSSPFIRLEGDYCGVPMSGGWMLLWVVAAPFERLMQLFNGSPVPGDFVITFLKSLLISLLLFSLVLPFLGTILLIRKGDSSRLRLFQKIALGLATGVSLWSGLNSHPNLFWAVWGVWLYAGLAFCTLILELLTTGKNVSRQIP